MLEISPSTMHHLPHVETATCHTPLAIVATAPPHSPPLINEDHHTHRGTPPLDRFPRSEPTTRSCRRRHQNILFEIGKSMSPNETKTKRKSKTTNVRSRGDHARFQVVTRSTQMNKHSPKRGHHRTLQIQLSSNFTRPHVKFADFPKVSSPRADTAKNYVHFPFSFPHHLTKNSLTLENETHATRQRHLSRERECFFVVICVPASRAGGVRLFWLCCATAFRAGCLMFTN